jgi:hypothetical protein
MEKISIKKSELIKKPLWFHKRNLIQTASGYGKNLKTEYMLKHNNRLKRVYCYCFSNSGTLFIKSGKNEIIIDID